MLAVFLGTCLLYYGSELNEETKNTKFTADFYPFDEKTVFTGSKETDVLLSQLAMPWDQSGVGFSAMLSNVTSFTEYLKAFKFNETVEVRIVTKLLEIEYARILLTFALNC